MVSSAREKIEERDNIAAGALCSRLDKALVAYLPIITDYGPISLEQALNIAEQAFGEGNAALIRRCWNGCFVEVWKDKFE